MRPRTLYVLLLTAAIVWVLPLLGLAVAGMPISNELGFPPRTRFVPHPPFAWGAFLVLALPAAAALAAFWVAIGNARSAAFGPPRRRFPWWGWLGLALLGASWFLAWRDGLVPPGWRRHVFTPLWFGYILVMNGLAHRRRGAALLTHRTRWFAALFPVSAAFWWLFEHLNRFAGNWYYTGVSASGDWDYFLQATLPFSTVLPAVASTWAWLRTFPRLDAMALPAVRGSSIALWSAFAAALAALACIGIWPDLLFPALWLAPVPILVGLQKQLLGDTLLAPLAHGDWRPVLQPALAGLVCGALWEMWNYGSAAQWHYSVPYVQRFLVFEMPLLGYAGYLPFGLECALVMDLVAQMAGRRSVWPLEAD